MQSRSLLAIMLVLWTIVGHTADVEYLTSEDNLALNLPFSEATRVGDTIYLSGQVGNIPGTIELARGGIRGETKQTLENIRAVLERHGSSLDKVAKCTVFLADIADWPAVNEVYREFFGPQYPARSSVGASGLAIGARVEIECIAVTAKTSANR